MAPEVGYLHSSLCDQLIDVQPLCPLYLIWLCKLSLGIMGSLPEAQQAF